MNAANRVNVPAANDVPNLRAPKAKKVRPRAYMGRNGAGKRGVGLRPPGPGPGRAPPDHRPLPAQSAGFGAGLFGRMTPTSRALDSFEYDALKLFDAVVHLGKPGDCH